MAFVEVQLKNRVGPALLDEKEYRANPDKWTLYIEPKAEEPEDPRPEPAPKKTKESKRAVKIQPLDVPETTGTIPE